MKPIAFVDIDGVLNRFGTSVNNQDRDSLFVTSATSRGKAWPMLLSHRDKRRLESLEPDFELAWGTTWEHEAHNVGSQIGLPDFPIKALTLLNEFSKIPGVVRAANGRPFIWFEDMYTTRDLLDYVKDRPGQIHPRSIIITTNSRIGLTDDHVEQALTWINET